MSKIAYQTDDNSFYTGQVECQPSPMEPGVYLIPRGATEVPPPKNFDGSQFIQQFDWDLQTWSLVPRPEGR
jgi:hypothetical protein